MDGSSSRGSLPPLSNYRVGRRLGFGAFGTVREAQHISTGIKVAMKKLVRQTISDSDWERVNREIKIMRLLSHPHIVRLYEVIETQSTIYVIMEYMNSGELFYYIITNGRLEENEARHYFQQIISGVESCHLHKVVHRDLKPENLLLDKKSNVKIADFGLANVMRDGQLLKTSCGSPSYAAPEILSGRLYAGPEVDVWSCGVILYALLTAVLPFDDENISALSAKIKPPECTDRREVYVRPIYPVQSKWVLGFKSFASPHETIRDVLAVLRSLNVRWKKIGPYNIKCMWKPKVKSYNMPIAPDCQNVPIQSSSKEVSSPCDAVKFEIQLYRFTAESYLLDWQRCNGPPFLFIELCAGFRACAIA
ncbi:serine/threonine-protein kinase, SIK1/2, KA1 domain/Ssp2 [Artemisia annua]|uniref:non-specific serine/threonine protein kinase n=1 Tax=Artemisia annua TaxID=35608 RepID=A0A2U1MIK4_ARTAN|nr:serine/threonine-protein kinase, SIK1/2, KA1 domain/Ssp2 [Artemisia annua]